MYSFRKPRKYNYSTPTKTEASVNNENCENQNNSNEGESSKDKISRLPSNLALKTPVLFSPSNISSPSRNDVWKKELGLEEPSSEEEKSSHSDDEPQPNKISNSGFCSVMELQALQTELDRKEKQREEVLKQLQINSDKVKAYKKQLNKSEESKRTQLKKAMKNYESQLKEKKDLIVNLQEIIEEKDLQIREIEATKCSKSQQTLITRHSTQKLIDLLLLAQDDKGRTMETVLKLQSVIDQLEQELLLSKKSLTEAEMKNTKLSFQNVELQTEKLSVPEDKENYLIVKSNPMHGTDIDYEKQIENLNFIIKEKESEMRMNELKHIEEINSLQTKIQNTESKYMLAVGTPPKYLATCKKINEAYEHRLTEISELELKCKEQEVTIVNLKEESKEKVEKLERKVVYLESKLQENDKKNEELITKYYTIDQQLLASQNAFKKQQSHNKTLEERLTRKDNDIELIRSEMKQTVEALLEEKDKAVATITSEASHETSQMAESMTSCLSQIEMLKTRTQKLRQDKNDLVIEIKFWKENAADEAQLLGTKVMKAIENLNKTKTELRMKYQREMKLRKKYHNELIELKGNIRVFCRIRPTIKEDYETQECPESVVHFDAEDDSLIHVTSVKTGPKTFEVDRVFGETSSQEEVFDEVKSLITACIDGYNVCIFAYGQTGSGKTYTMEGSEVDPGINQRALEELFNCTKERSDWNYIISVNVMEIYNETLRDLLSTEPETKLEIKQGKDGLYIPDLNHVQVNSRQQINEVFALGHSNRATAATNMNEHSSRSHAILTITVGGENTITGAILTGKLNLVDLAGSERLSKSGSEGQRIIETKNINKSLSSLGDVIHALKNKSPHIPYRNSKLTYLLQDSLGGDCKTLMVVQVSPVEKNKAETICSLNFAQRVKTVELGPATIKRVNAPESAIRGEQLYSSPRNKIQKFKENTSVKSSIYQTP